jgi:MinD-like ATPase involved in chromosome partitioning or flagellar assembly
MATTTTSFGFQRVDDGDRDWNNVSLRFNADRADTLFSGHTRLGSGTPTIAAGTGAGTGPTVAIAGNDNAGVITVTTGTAPAASATVATITFGQAFGAIPRAVVLTDAGPSAAALSGAGKVYADQSVLGLTSWQVKSGAMALAATTQFKWWYRVDP